MLNTRILLAGLLGLTAAAAQTKKDPGPQPRQVTPGLAPSDAIILFNGNDLGNWTRRDGQPAKWRVENGELVTVTRGGDIQTKETYRNAQLHLEFKIPPMPDQKGQRRGNSGVFLQGRYEVQILDGIDNPTYGDGTIGGVYGVAAPLVNAARRAGEWQTYDILFHAAVCDDAGLKVLKRPFVTVLLNGILVQDHVEIPEKADGNRRAGARVVCAAGPLLLQDHAGFPGAPVTDMRFRNIWMRQLP
jgi:hypothetical protein